MNISPALQTMIIVVITTVTTNFALQNIHHAYAATSTFVDGIVIGDTVLSGSLLLDVNGAIGATSICDAAGANCFSPASVGGGVSGSGTAGYVPKFSAGSTLANSLIQDDGTNVGIGRAPSQKLDVNGNIVNRGGTMFFQGLSQSLYGDGSTALYFDSNDATVSRLILRDSDNDQYGSLYGSQGDYLGLLDGDGNWAIQHYKDNHTLWNINNIEYMRLTSTELNLDNTLDLNGDLQVSGNILFNTDTTGDYLGYATQDGVTYYENGVAQWRLTGNANNYINGGNLGIGTTSPSAKLDVVGDAEVSGNASVGGALSVTGNLNVTGGINSNGDDNHSFLTDRADDGTYEWVGWYSGSSRAGIFLWDGSWNGCSASRFCIVGESHQLMLKSNTGTVLVDDELEVTGKVRADTYCRKGGGNCIDLIDYNERVAVHEYCDGFSYCLANTGGSGSFIGYLVK